MPRTKCGFDDDPATGIKGRDALVVHGPSMLIDVGFDAAYTPAGGLVPTPAMKGIWALVDTGATESFIDAKLAAQLALPVIDKRKVSGISGTDEVTVHLAQIHVPGLAFTIYGPFAAVRLAEGGQAHRALIGRTFLQNFTMIYNGLTGDVEIYS